MSILNDNIIKSMLNSKDKENLFITATVYSLSPLQVKLYPGDNAIPVKSLTGSIGITTGSNVLMVRYQSKYIIIGVIGNIIDLTDKQDNIQYIKKSSTQTVNNSETLVNDTDLVATLPPNGVFDIEVKLNANGQETSDIVIDWETTGDVEQLTTRGCLGPGPSNTDSANTSPRMTSHNLTTDVAYGLDSTYGSFIFEKFLVQTGSSGGTLQMRFAQDTAQAHDTQISSNSYMIVTPVSE